MPTFSAHSTSTSPVPTRPNSPTSNLLRSDYYLPGGDLYIQVDNILFCVHSYFFVRESSRWLHLLRHTTRGQTIHHPIILVDEFHITPPASPRTFAQFLWLFYNPYYHVHDLSTAALWEIEAYAACWQMQNILDFVDRELHRIIRHHRRLQTATSWLTLSPHDESDPSHESTTETWDLSERPYEDWISGPDVVDEISLLLNRQHLEDGRD